MRTLISRSLVGWYTVVVVLLLFGTRSVPAQIRTVRLLGDFQEGWQHNWLERKQSQLPTSYDFDEDKSRQRKRYRVVDEKDDRVLRIDSNDSATALWRSASGFLLWAQARSHGDGK